LVALGELGILRAAGGNDDLALAVELLRAVHNRQAAYAEAGGEHRHHARLGDILVHGAPPLLPGRLPEDPNRTAAMSPYPDGGPVAKAGCPVVGVLPTSRHVGQGLHQARNMGRPFAYLEPG